jgi:hypothetical protein
MDPVDPKERWLLPLLEVIGARPAMYLGSGSVLALECYIDGYASARAALGFPRFGEGEGELLDGFNEWLKAKLGRENSNLWRSKCVELLDPSDNNARTFCILWKEFLSSKGVSISPTEVERFAQRWKDQ